MKPQMLIGVILIASMGLLVETEGSPAMCKKGHEIRMGANWKMTNAEWKVTRRDIIRYDPIVFYKMISGAAGRETTVTVLPEYNDDGELLLGTRVDHQTVPQGSGLKIHNLPIYNIKWARPEGDSSFVMKNTVTIANDSVNVTISITFADGKETRTTVLLEPSSTTSVLAASTAWLDRYYAKNGQNQERFQEGDMCYSTVGDEVIPTSDPKGPEERTVDDKNEHSGAGGHRRACFLLMLLIIVLG